jgi:hypothetical protein
MKKFLISEKQLKFIVDNFDLLNEQENIQTRSLPTIDFNNSFLDNMVKIYQNDNLNKTLSELDNYIKQARKENKEVLESISITIDAGSSSLPATNKLPAGINKPDHTYNGIVPENKWTTSTKRIQQEAINKLPSNYNPKNGYYRILDGNKYLAEQRANNLKIYLDQYIKNKYGNIKIDINIKNVNESTTKFVSATIDSVVFKRKKILRNFYIEDYIIKNSEGKYFVPISPSKVWGTKKLNSNNDFTKEKSQELLKKIITDREVLVIDYPKAKNSEYESTYGLNKPYVEIKKLIDITPDEQLTGVYRAWFETFNDWETEKNYIQKYKQATATEGDVDKNKRFAGAGFIPRKSGKTQIPNN